MRLFSPKLLWVLLFSYREVWVFNQLDLVSFWCRCQTTHFSYSSQSRYNSTRNFKDDVFLLLPYLAVFTTTLRFYRIFTDLQRRIFPVAISRSAAVQVRGKIRTQLMKLCEYLRIVWYLLREKLKLFPLNYAQLLSGRSRLHTNWLCTCQLILNLVVSQ